MGEKILGIYYGNVLKGEIQETGDTKQITYKSLIVDLEDIFFWRMNDFLSVRKSEGTN